MTTRKTENKKIFNVPLGIAVEIIYALFIIFTCALISFIVSKLIKQ